MFYFFLSIILSAKIKKTEKKATPKNILKKPSKQKLNKKPTLQNLNINNQKIPPNSKVDIDPEDITLDGMYHPTIWDPILRTKRFANVYKKVAGMRNYLKQHKVLKSKNRFGNISIMTFNLYCMENVEANNNAMVQAVKDFLDRGHPTFLVLQSVRRRVMDDIKSYLGNHYAMENTERSNRDSITGAMLFNPIIYDTKLIKILKSGYLENNNGEVYGSYIRVVDLRKKGKSLYTVINVDMYSTFKDVVKSEVSSLTGDIIDDQETSNHPVIIAGTINSMPDLLSNILNNQYINLIDMDKNNKNIYKTTVHMKGENNDGIQRDFIILRDNKKEMDLNYARILSTVYISEHFPVHAILGFHN